MGFICDKCKAKVFSPANFKPLWQISETEDTTELIGESVEFTTTLHELEDGVSLDFSLCSLFLGNVQKTTSVKDGERYRQVPYTSQNICDIWLGLERQASSVVAYSLHISTQPSIFGGIKDFVIHTAPGAV